MSVFLFAALGTWSCISCNCLPALMYGCDGTDACSGEVPLKTSWPEKENQKYLFYPQQILVLGKNSQLSLVSTLPVSFILKVSLLET